MKALAVGLVICLVAMALAPAYAQEKIAPLIEGEVAEFDGYLVPELRYIEFLEAENKADSLERQQGIERKFNERAIKLYQRQLEKATEPPPWYESVRFNRWLGFTLGIATATLAVYAGSRVTSQ